MREWVLRIRGRMREAVIKRREREGWGVGVGVSIRIFRRAMRPGGTRHALLTYLHAIRTDNAEFCDGVNDGVILGVEHVVISEIAVEVARVGAKQYEFFRCILTGEERVDVDAERGSMFHQEPTAHAARFAHFCQGQGNRSENLSYPSHALPGRFLVSPILAPQAIFV